MKKILTLGVILFSLLSSSLQAEDNMSITDIKGKSYKIVGTEEGLKVKGLEGKIVFLEFFGHRCPPCIKSIPHLINLQNKYKDKLAIIAVEVQGLGNNQLKKFAAKKGINYIVASDEKTKGLIDYISNRAQWQGSIPFMLAMDKTGKVQFAQAGMIPESSLEKLINQLDTLK